MVQLVQIGWNSLIILDNSIPNIEKNDMTIQFHEDRIIDLEDRKNGTNWNSYYT